MVRRTSLYRSAPTTRLFDAYRRAMNSQSSCHCASVRAVFHRSFPSTPQHHRDVPVWLFRITANPRAVSRSTTRSYTPSGVRPRSCGFAGRSGTGAVSRTISLENGRRTLLSPSSAKPSMTLSSGARSRPSGVWWAISPAWWFAGSDLEPEPVHVPLAPCQLPDLSLNRLPSASTTCRPRVLSGAFQSAGATAAGEGTAGERAAGRGSAGAAAAAGRAPVKVDAVSRAMSAIGPDLTVGP